MYPFTIPKYSTLLNQVAQYMTAAETHNQHKKNSEAKQSLYSAMEVIKALDLNINEDHPFPNNDIKPMIRFAKAYLQCKNLSIQLQLLEWTEEGYSEDYAFKTNKIIQAFTKLETKLSKLSIDNQEFLNFKNTDMPALKNRIASFSENISDQFFSVFLNDSDESDLIKQKWLRDAKEWMLTAKTLQTTPFSQTQTMGLLYILDQCVTHLDPANYLPELQTNLIPLEEGMDLPSQIELLGYHFTTLRHGGESVYAMAFVKDQIKTRYRQLDLDNQNTYRHLYESVDNEPIQVESIPLEDVFVNSEPDLSSGDNASSSPALPPLQAYEIRAQEILTSQLETYEDADEIAKPFELGKILVQFYKEGIPNPILLENNFSQFIDDLLVSIELTRLMSLPCDESHQKILMQILSKQLNLLCLSAQTSLDNCMDPMVLTQQIKQLVQCRQITNQIQQDRKLQTLQYATDDLAMLLEKMGDKVELLALCDDIHNHLRQYQQLLKQQQHPTEWTLVFPQEFIQSLNELLLMAEHKQLSLAADLKAAVKQIEFEQVSLANKALNYRIQTALGNFQAFVHQVQEGQFDEHTCNSIDGELKYLLIQAQTDSPDFQQSIQQAIDTITSIRHVARKAQIDTNLSRLDSWLSLEQKRSLYQAVSPILMLLEPSLLSEIDKKNYLSVIKQAFEITHSSQYLSLLERFAKAWALEDSEFTNHVIQYIVHNQPYALTQTQFPKKRVAFDMEAQPSANQNSPSISKPDIPLESIEQSDVLTNAIYFNNFLAFAKHDDNHFGVNCLARLSFRLAQEIWSLKSFPSYARLMTVYDTLMLARQLDPSDTQLLEQIESEIRRLYQDQKYKAGINNSLHFAKQSTHQTELEKRVLPTRCFYVFYQHIENILSELETHCSNGTGHYQDSANTLYKNWIVRLSQDPHMNQRVTSAMDYAKVANILPNGLSASLTEELPNTPEKRIKIDSPAFPNQQAFNNSLLDESKDTFSKKLQTMCTTDGQQRMAKFLLRTITGNISILQFALIKHRQDNVREVIKYIQGVLDLKSQPVQQILGYKNSTTGYTLLHSCAMTGDIKLLALVIDVYEKSLGKLALIQALETKSLNGFIPSCPSSNPKAGEVNQFLTKKLEGLKQSSQLSANSLFQAIDERPTNGHSSNTQNFHN
ncbi:hypothetical protein [Legionella sp. W05-934-2]|uniref:hypothetical protein n=1 Tax=Legionella sp. W05-934-2 TaxID=1198649 RepID=UPI003462BBC1